jgi:hypothetical protein
MSYASDAAIAFAMHVDTHNLTYEAGMGLAEEVAEEIQVVAEERDQIPGIRHEGETEA